MIDSSYRFGSVEKASAFKEAVDEAERVNTAILEKQAAESAKRQRQRQREARPGFDLFSGVPSLPLLPPEVLELECFKPGNLNLFGRLQRAAKKAAAQPAARDAEGVEEEQVTLTLT